MRVRSAVRRLCKDCRVLKRKKGIIWILCKSNPKHKQRQGMSTIAYDGPLPIMPFRAQNSSENSLIRSLREGLASFVIKNPTPPPSSYGGKLGLATLLE